MRRKATYYRSASVAALVVGSLWAVRGAGATTVSISGEQFTGTPPVGLEVPFPTMTTGSFTHFDPTSVLGGIASSLGPSSSATYSIASMSGAFTLLWGSPGASHQVQFFSGANGTGQLEGSFTGADLLCGGCDFSLVTFSAIGGSIGSVVLSNSGPTAFEYRIPELSDPNLPPPPSPPPPVVPPPEIPLPGALPLFLGGLAALSLFGKRRHSRA